MAIFLFLALGPLAHFLPPPSPTHGAEWYFQFYMNNLLGVRLAGIALMISACMVGIFSGALVSLARAMEGPGGPWTNVLLLMSAMVSTTFFMSGVFFCLAAFRPDRTAEEVYLLSDLAWIGLVIPGVPATIQTIALAFATLSDKRARPILPRWSAYMNIWFGIIFLPGCFVAMFQTGPFAWNGILAFWLPAIFFGLWFLVLLWLIWTRLTDELLSSPQG
ncbi:MAG: hypothetical protein RJS97_00285 [Parvibaculaceae bacterium]